MNTTLNDTNSAAYPEVLAFLNKLNPLQSPFFGKVWDTFSPKPNPFVTDEYTVLTRAYTAPEVVDGTSGAGLLWDSASTTTALPISAGTIDRLTVGDILLYASEIVVVKSVDRSGNTIDVYERGAGDTSGAQHYATSGGSGTTIKIIGNAQIEGTIGATAMAESTGKVTNYCQIIEELVDLSKENTDQARLTGATGQVLREEAMERVMRKIARSSIYGTARQGTASIPAMTRGLISSLEDISGGIKTAVSGAFTETTLKDIMDDVVDAGGVANAIVLSPTNKRIANDFTGADSITTTRDSRTGGQVIDGYLHDGSGVVPFIVDIDFPNDKVAVINTRYLTKGWKENDGLRFVPETNVGSREKKETLQGKFGLSVEAIGQSHGLLTNIS